MALLMSACAGPHKLPGTPNVFKMPMANSAPSYVVAQASLATQDKVFFVTDRKQINEDLENSVFGSDRSDSMSMGYVSVELTPAGQESNTRVQVNVAKTLTLTEFPSTPLPVVKSLNGISIREDVKNRYEQSSRLMKDEITRHMQENNQRELVLFVHGFKNSFNDAVLSLNDIWQFSGKSAAPMIYTWPAGASGIMSYFTDRESGEFTIFHLKETLRILISIEQVEKIHIIAHSRGTDVTTTALRELVIEARAKSEDPRKTLKVSNLILAAPDLDYGVVKQRLIAEQFGRAFGQITIYMNKGDSALGISQILMKGVRFGRLLASQQGAIESEIFAAIDNVAFINVEDVGGFVGHGYFHQHPGVMSDIIVLLKTNSRPGTSARPLSHVRSNFWRLGNKYLLDSDKNISEPLSLPQATHDSD